jgi:hypothetical protein
MFDIKHCVGTLTCMVVAMSLVLSAQEQGLVNRRIPFRLPFIATPLTPYSLQTGIAQLAWTARVPIGFEAPLDQPWQPAPGARALAVAGLTIEEVLDAITTQEPRYRWSEDDGVIHLRPGVAFEDPRNVVNRRIDSFTMDNTTLPRALREVQLTLHPEWRQSGIVGSGPAPTALGVKVFTVEVEHTTVGGVLDAIVKAHGAASWSVTYDRDSNERVVSKISFHTFDGWGITH